MSQIEKTLAEKLHQVEDPEEMLALSERVLKLNLYNEVGIRQKLNALMEKGHFSDICSFLESYSQHNPYPLALAYAYYRCERYLDCFEVIGRFSSSTTDAQMPLSLLSAQCMYRSSKLEDAFAMYQDLLNSKDLPTDLKQLLVVNSLAILSEFEASECSLQLEKLDPWLRNLDSPDIRNNLGVALSSIGKSEEAMRLWLQESSLDQFLENHRGTVEEEPSNFVTLLAVAMSLKNVCTKRLCDALSLNRKLSKNECVVTEMNSIKLNNMINTFQCIKGLRTLTEHSGKLTKRQNFVVEYNTVFYMMRLGHHQTALQRAKNLYMDYPYELLAAQLYVHVMTSIYPKKVTALVSTILKKLPCDTATPFSSDQFTFILFLAQRLWDLHGKIELVELVLCHLPENKRFSVPLLLTVSRMAQKSNQISKAANVLEQGVKYWENKKGSSAYFALLKELAVLYSSAKKLDEGVKVLKKLVEISPSKEVLAKLVLLLSEINPDEAILFAERLTSTDEETDRPELSTLETEDLPRVKHYTTESHSAPASPFLRNKMLKKRRKRTRAHKVDTSTNLPLDPDRWLPLSERSSMKKLGKKTLARLAEERRLLAQEKRETFNNKLIEATQV